MNIKARLYCRKEENKFDERGYIYCWYYEVTNAETGNVLASDNTGNWQHMFDSALRDLVAIRRCAYLGVLKESRGWR